jgi:hypothetical protein
MRTGEAPMARLFGNYLRIVGASALVSLAFLFGSLDPFLRAAPVTAAAVSNRTPPVSVNRYRKDDRLPLLKSLDNSGRAGTGSCDLRGSSRAQWFAGVQTGACRLRSRLQSGRVSVARGRVWALHHLITVA